MEANCQMCRPDPNCCYRTIEGERVLMKNRETRIVWWNSKNVALNVAKQIEDCGAKAEFIGFY